MAGQVSFAGVIRALSYRNYAIFNSCNTAAMIGEWMQRVGLGWLAWQMTESTAWLGIVACADMVPTMLISPIAGAYCDRYDRLKFARVTISLAAIQPALLSLLFFADLLTIWLIVALAAYSGVVSAFNQASRLAIVPYLVAREELSPAVALSSITYNISRFIGPAIAGTVIATAGAGYTFLCNLATWLILVASLFYIKLNAHDAPHRGRGHILTDTVDGLRYTMRHPGIGPVMFLLIVGSMGQRPFVELLPGYADLVFSRGPEALGWMVSIVGLGALLGAIYLSARATMRGLTAVSVHAVLVGALSLVAFTMSGEFWLAMIFLFFVGVTLSISSTGIMTLVQASVDSHMRGRVLSLYGLIFRGGPAIGALAMGWAAERVGLQIPIGVGAVFCIVLWAWVSRGLAATAAVLESEPPAAQRVARPLSQEEHS